jgi:hypothetical protein
VLSAHRDTKRLQALIGVPLFGLKRPSHLQQSLLRSARELTLHPRCGVGVDQVFLGGLVDLPHGVGEVLLGGLRALRIALVIALLWRRRISSRFTILVACLELGIGYLKLSIF